MSGWNNAGSATSMQYIAIYCDMLKFKMYPTCMLRNFDHVFLHGPVALPPTPEYWEEAAKGCTLPSRPEYWEEPATGWRSSCRFSLVCLECYLALSENGEYLIPSNA